MGNCAPGTRESRSWIESFINLSHELLAEFLCDIGGNGGFKIVDGVLERFFGKHNWLLIADVVGLPRLERYQWLASVRVAVTLRFDFLKRDVEHVIVAFGESGDSPWPKEKQELFAWERVGRLRDLLEQSRLESFERADGLAVKVSQILVAGMLGEMEVRLVIGALQLKEAQH